MIDSVLLASISLLNVSNGITRTTCEICSKLTIKTSVVVFFFHFNCNRIFIVTAAKLI